MGVVRLTSPYERIRDHPTTARIPLAYLGQFDFVQKRYPFDDAYAPDRSLFHIAHRRGYSWSHYGYPRSDTRLASVRRWVKHNVEPGPRLLYLHISDLDAVGHRWGPDSPRTTRELRRVDAGLESLVKTIRQRLAPTAILIFGDHGMSRVERTLDVESMLGELNGRPGEDFMYFLDSTMARFWFRSDRTRREITNRLADVQGLRLLDDAARRELHLDYEHRRFGDSLYLAQEACIIHPSFYGRREPPRGMHGYGPDVSANHAALIVSPKLASGGTNLDTLAAHPMTFVYRVARTLLENES